MPDEPIKTTPPAPHDASAQPQPAPPTQALDPTGVPWENRVAEWKRKFEEKDAENLRYQTQLGQLIAQRNAPPPQPPYPNQPYPAPYPNQPYPPQPTYGANPPGDYFITDPSTGQPVKFDSATRAFVEQVAQRMAHQTRDELLARAQLNQEIGQDQEIQQEAQKEFAALSADPLYAGYDQRAKEALAVKAASANIWRKRAQANQQTTTQQQITDANRAQAGLATLPPTAGAATTVATTKEQWIKDFMANPKNLHMLRSFWRLDPDSEEGRKRLLSVAESAYEGVNLGGKLGTAIQVLQGGNQ